MLKFSKKSIPTEYRKYEVVNDWSLWVWIYPYRLDTLIIDATLTFGGFRPLYQGIITFWMILWTYSSVWSWWQSLIQLFPFASKIFYLHAEIHHVSKGQHYDHRAKLIGSRRGKLRPLKHFESWIKDRHQHLK